MSLQILNAALSKTRALSQLSTQAWLSHQEIRGEKVKLFRDYADGDHRANLTTEMRNLLRINQKGSLNEFNNNYMDVVIQTMVDRLSVERIEADNDAGTEWIKDLLKDNRFDQKQVSVTESAVRDGDTYVLAYYDADMGRVCFKEQPAYDGNDGMVLLYQTLDDDAPELAIKIWRLTLSEGGFADTTRVNFYFADRVERYISMAGGTLQHYLEDPMNADSWLSWWTTTGKPGGDPLGVPVIPFRNRGALYSEHGMSEIENAIPLQDALNRTLYSMIMAAELTAFQIKWAKGFTPPAAITPGMFIAITGENGGPLNKDDVAELGVMEQGELAPFLDMARYLANEIGRITRTPAPEFMSGDAASGEALKQRESGLLGKVKRFQTRAGNAWEDLVMLAARIQTVYGSKKPPAFKSANTIWRDPEIRNDATTVANAVAVAEWVDLRTKLQSVAGVFGWDETKIDQIVAEKQAESTKAIAALGSTLPGFNQFSAPNGAAPPGVPAPAQQPLPVAA